MYYLILLLYNNIDICRSYKPNAIPKMLYANMASFFKSNKTFCLLFPTNIANLYIAGFACILKCIQLFHNI